MDVYKPITEKYNSEFSLKDSGNVRFIISNIINDVL